MIVSSDRLHSDEHVLLAILRVILAARYIRVTCHSSEVRQARTCHATSSNWTRFLSRVQVLDTVREPTEGNSERSVKPHVRDSHQLPHLANNERHTSISRARHDNNNEWRVPRRQHMCRWRSVGCRHSGIADRDATRNERVAVSLMNGYHFWLTVCISRMHTLFGSQSNPSNRSGYLAGSGLFIGRTKCVRYGHGRDFYVIPGIGTRIRTLRAVFGSQIFSRIKGRRACYGHCRKPCPPRNKELKLVTPTVRHGAKLSLKSYKAW